MDDVVKILGGAACGLGVVAAVWRGLNGRMNRQKARMDKLADDMVLSQVCEERHRHINKALEEHGKKLDRIEKMIHDLTRIINGK